MAQLPAIALYHKLGYIDEHNLCYISFTRL